MQKQTTACFSGYREHKFSFSLDDKEQYQKLSVSILNSIHKATVVYGVNTFLCGGAQGFDIICGETIINNKHKFLSPLNLITVVPCKNQPEKWNANWQTRYKNLLANSNEVITLSENYFSGCYIKRNTFMIENSSVLICYYDGKKGGTQNTLEHAKKNKLHIINLPHSMENSNWNQLSLL